MSNLMLAQNLDNLRLPKASDPLSRVTLTDRILGCLGGSLLSALVETLGEEQQAVGSLPEGSRLEIGLSDVNGDPDFSYKPDSVYLNFSFPARGKVKHTQLSIGTEKDRPEALSQGLRKQLKVCGILARTD